MAEAGAVVNITQQFFGAFQLKERGIRKHPVKNEVQLLGTYYLHL